jgi:hypothetical protein
MVVKSKEHRVYKATEGCRSVCKDNRGDIGRRMGQRGFRRLRRTNQRR